MKTNIIKLKIVKIKQQNSSNYIRFTVACFKSFGENCRHPCSLHCFNNTCNTHNGRCLIGCKDGFYGEWCAKGNDLMYF